MNIEAPSSICGPSVEQMTQKTRKKMAQDIKIKEDTFPECEVVGIKYSLIDRNLSSVAVVDVTASLDSKNLHGTVNDPKTGSVDYSTVCDECRKSSATCPGHFGIISMGSQHYNYICLDEIAKVLKCVCWNPDCSGGGSLIPPENAEALGLSKLKGKLRLDAVYNIVGGNSSGGNCSYCGKVTPNISRSPGLPPIYKANIGNDSEWIVSPGDAYTVLDRVSDADAAFLGFNVAGGSHPRNFVIYQFPLTPICTRPPVFVGGVMTNDDLTTKYNELFNKAKTSIGNSATKDTNSTDIYKLMSQIIDNKEKAVKHTKELIPAIKKRIDGKKGYVRNAMMGKRKDNTARSVIVCDSSLRFGEIGVPSDIAEMMPYSVRVTRYNGDEIAKLFGSSFEENQVKTVISTFGAGKDMDIIITESNWERFQKLVCSKSGVGWIVQRPLKTGDYIFGGRQPTIGASSLMGFRAVIKPGKVFRLNMCYTTPFNADFDGDEMHFHFPQTIRSQVEARTVVNCVNRILDPNSNGPNFGIVYNGLTSGYLLTLDKGWMFTPEKWAEGYAICGKRHGEIGSDTFNTFLERLRSEGVEPLSGKALYSTLLRDDFYYDRYNHVDKKGFLIRRGILVSGVLKKAFNGPARGSILQSLYHQYGRDECVEYLSRCVWLLDWFISYRGFSMGFDDCYFSDAQYAQVRRAISSEIISANQKTKELLKKKKLNDIVITEESIFESEHKERQLLEFVKKIKTASDVLVCGDDGFLSKSNPIYQMILSGSKGGEENIRQIMGCVGQQLIYGKRPEKTLTQEKRCCPYFENGDDSPLARGFCQHSFLEGLDPSEMYFHALAVRVGLLETGIGTSITGSMQRKMTKVGESQLINHQGMVCNTSGNIFSLSLLDNFDPKKQMTFFGNPEEKGGMCLFADIREIAGKLSQ